MAVKSRERFSSSSTGAAIASTTATWTRVNGGTTIATDDTDAEGIAEVDLAVVVSSVPVLLPGSHYVSLTSGGVTKRAGDSRIMGVVGRFSLADLITAFRGLFSAGVESGYLNSMAVLAGVSGLTTRVDTGGFNIQGTIVENDTIRTITHATADATNPRIDVVGVRVTLATTDYGKVELFVLTGTPAASPAAPALTQNASTWEEKLADVTVPAGASTIITGNISDQRTYAAPSYVDATKINTGTIPALNVTTATVTGTITTTGQTRDTATAPTIAAAAAAGSTATITSSTGGAEWGRFILTPGGTGIAAGTIVTVTFATARPNTNYTVSLDAGDSDAATAIRSIGVYVAHTPNTTGFSIVSDGALVSGTTYRFGYIVRGG